MNRAPRPHNLGNRARLLNDFQQRAGHPPRLQLDTIKVDRAFVKGMLTDPAHARIVEAIIRLGYGMGLTVVAEGIETSAQAAALAALGCGHGQGFLMAHPMPAEDVIAVVDRVFPFKHIRAMAAE